MSEGPELHESDGFDVDNGFWGLDKALSAFVVTAILLGLCLTVLFVMVPLSVYSQLIYSGYWAVLTPCERIWCMVTGNFEASIEATKTKEKTFAEDRRTREDEASQSGSQVFTSVVRFHLSKGASKSRLSEGTTPSRLSRASTAMVLASANEDQPKSEKESRCCHWTSFHSLFAKVETAWTRAFKRLVSLFFEAKGEPQPLVGAPRYLAAVCIVLTFLPAAVLLFAYRVARLELFFDIAPQSYETRRARKVLKVIRVLISMLVVSFLLVYVPVHSTSSVTETLDCIYASCQENKWRIGVGLPDLTCDAAKSSGIIQPSFWSDLVDIVQAALTLTVLTLLAEWKETIEGKNEVGAELLRKVDHAMGQDIHPDKHPDTPDNTLSLVVPTLSLVFLTANHRKYRTKRKC